MLFLTRVEIVNSIAFSNLYFVSGSVYPASIRGSIRAELALPD